MGLATSPFRVDRDRIGCSPFFARLAGVTQVVSPAGPGQLVHNRLTHTMKVARSPGRSPSGWPATRRDADC